MTARQEAMFDIPAAPVAPTPGWTCSRCGNDDPRRLTIDASMPSLDPNYARGLCDCTRSRRIGGRPVRERVVLIRSELFNRPRFEEHKVAKAEAKLLQRYKRGDLLSDDEKDAVRAILARNDR